MKISFFLIGIFCLLDFEAHSQDIRSSDFYKAFYKYFYFSGYSGYKDKIPQFHSIKLNSNADGLITKWQLSTSVDSTLEKSITKALFRMDEKQLQIGNYKNCTMILPIIILEGTPKSIKQGMWDYKFENKGSTLNVQLLPPVVLFMDFSHMIDN